MRNSIDLLADASHMATGWLFSPRAGAIADLNDLIFFQRIYAFLDDEINEFMSNFMGRGMKLVGTVALVLLITWVLVQGYRIMKGISRDSMSAFTLQAARNAFIILTATSMALFAGDISVVLSQGLPNGIHSFVTGQSGSPYEQIDHSLGYMQLALTSIDALQTGGDLGLEEAKNRAKWFTGIGVGLPAVLAGSMLMLFRLAIALFVGFGPVFILCLMFDYTRQLFHRWLILAIGTIFALAVMSFTVTLALDAILAVTASFWAGKLLLASNPEGVTSVAMQQGGLGLFMAALILAAPPMAAAFFQGTIGQFAAYRLIGRNTASGGDQQRLPDGRPSGGSAPGSSSHGMNPQANVIQTPSVGATPASGNNPTVNPGSNNAGFAAQTGSGGAVSTGSHGAPDSSP